MNINILRAAIEFSSDGILISDIDGNVIYVNDAYEQTTGLKKERLINKNLRTLQEEKLFNRSVSLSVLEDEVPESITFLDTIPRTKADKADYKLLEEMAKEEVEIKIKKRELK